MALYGPKKGKGPKRKRTKDYLNRFLSTHINPQATTTSTPVLGSGTLATRNPTKLTSIRRIVADPVRGEQVGRDAVERTATQAPKRAANQGFVPLKHVAPHVERAVGARRSGVCAHVGQIAHDVCCSSPSWCRRRERSAVGAVLLLVGY